ncbi:hypothetical protein E2C01_050406 [Portunus trituberculatus]|uniref:Uncharacterized protein n=1 Tax=Portunus trituberculatus TaxID=210409 RepID=A0A5B7GGB5_PORTR|nr:hypothetical protein [Portunus trituberculatus]
MHWNYYSGRRRTPPRVLQRGAAGVSNALRAALRGELRGGWTAGGKRMKADEGTRSRHPSPVLTLGGAFL